MGKILTDEIIYELLNERKVLPEDYIKKLKTKPKSMRKHEEKELLVHGEFGNEFLLLIRKNRIDPLDFSIILRYRDLEGRSFNLVRYNGKHNHINKLEGHHFRDFHIHKATERYQENGFDIETYAEPTQKYSSFDEAFKSFINDLKFNLEQPRNTSDLLDYGGE